MFFIVAKTVWFWLQPSAIVLLCLSCGFVAVLAGLTSAARVLLGISLAVFLVAVSPVSALIYLPLESRFPRADLSRGPVAGIMILGGTEETDIAAYRHVHAFSDGGERFTEAVELARRLPKARVVFCGGHGDLVPNELNTATPIRDMLVGMGVGADRVVTEDKSRDTRENALFCKAMLQPRAGERWLLLTSAWHIPRAIGTFRTAGFPVEAWPVDYRTTGWSDETSFAASAADGLRRLDVVAKEYVGLLMYRLSGRTDELLPSP